MPLFVGKNWFRDNMTPYLSAIKTSLKNKFVDGSDPLDASYVDGSVYIGTTNDNASLDKNKLHVEGSTKITGVLKLPFEASNGKVLTSGVDGSTSWQYTGGDGSVGTSLANGFYYGGVASRSRRLHIKLPYSVLIASGMFHLTVEGFNYSVARNYGVTFSGYCHKSGAKLHLPSVKYTESTVNYIVEAIGYAGAKGTRHIYLSIKFSSAMTYHTCKFTSMVVGNGTVFLVDSMGTPSELDDISSEIAIGDRQALITMTASVGMFSATPDLAVLVDGDVTTSVLTSDPVSSTGMHITAQFTVSRTVKAIALKTTAATDHGAVIFQVSDDGANWSSTGNYTTFQGYKRMVVPTPIAGTYFRIEWVGDTLQSSNTFYEIEYEE
jgi:hypothetical protein